MILGQLLSTSAVRQSEVRQRVVGTLGRAAAAEFGLVGEACRSLIGVEGGYDNPFESREDIDTVDERDELEVEVPECEMAPAIVEDSERELGWRFSIDDHLPEATDGVRRGHEEFAVTEKIAAGKRAMVRLCGRGL